MPATTIVVVAGEDDGVAHALAGRLPGLDVRLLTPAVLSQPGWEFRPGREDGGAVAGGARIATQDLGAVLVRLPWVREDDAYRLDPADRAYAAAEMSAFLLGWLSSLPCPVLNRPTTSCLAGPLWRSARWALAAASVGLAIEPVSCSAGTGERHRAPAPARPPVVATVVGERCLGVEDAALGDRLRDLARLAGADVLTVGLTSASADARFVAASPWPEVSDDAVLHEVLALAGVRSGCEPARVAA
jgi:hypothetical protein